jgi:hypothetical protein
VAFTVSALNAITIGVGVAGGVTALAGVTLAIVEGVTTPTTSKGYYGGYDYVITVNGEYGERYKKMKSNSRFLTRHLFRYLGRTLLPEQAANQRQ